MPPTTEMDSWLTQACEVLGLTDVPGLDLRDRVLELARDVAHGVARPAAPLTTFLLGIAVGATQADAAEVDRLIARLSSAAGDRPPAAARSRVDAARIRRAGGVKGVR